MWWQIAVDVKSEFGQIREPVLKIILSLRAASPVAVVHPWSKRRQEGGERGPGGTERPNPPVVAA